MKTFVYWAAAAASVIWFEPLVRLVVWGLLILMGERPEPYSPYPPTRL